MWNRKSDDPRVPGVPVKRDSGSNKCPGAFALCDISNTLSVINPENPNVIKSVITKPICETFSYAYRFDDRPPEIIFREGFAPKNSNYVQTACLYCHVEK